MLDKSGVKTCDGGDIGVYEHYGINMPLRARSELKDRVTHEAD